MLMFGHPGVTLGSAVLISTVLNRRLCPGSQTGKDGPRQGGGSGGIGAGLEALARHVDLRLLLVGSLLPDIIDKPLGQVFLRDISNGRIFAHTLLFVLVLTACGLYFYRRRRGSTGLLALAFGSLMHLVEDQMWGIPATLLWPLFGFSFAEVDLSQWVLDMLYALLTNPEVYVPELAGVTVLGWFAWHLWRGKRVWAFIKSGRV